MSKKVSELEELLKLLGANSVEDVQLCFTNTCGDYTGNYSSLVGIGANVSNTNPSYYYPDYHSMTILNNNNVPLLIRYHPENMNENNQYTYSEVFKIQNVQFTTNYNNQIYSPAIVINETILKLLDNKATIYTSLTCD